MSTSPETTPTPIKDQEIHSPASQNRSSFKYLGKSPSLQPMGCYVGKLAEKWQFPSDHLPIGITVDGTHILSWNVLDEAYMDWVIEKNSQGLSPSLIEDEHVYIGDSTLTVRDQHVVRLILETINHPTHPRQLLSLQECGPAFLEELRAHLPKNFSVISHHGEGLVFDTTLFECLEGKAVVNIFSEQPARAIQEVLLRNIKTNTQLRIINGHLPGNPDGPGRYEFAQYIHKTHNPAVTTIAMGDMNFNELEMADAMNKAFSNESPFTMHTPYCTNITPFVYNSKAIDHFFIYSPKKATTTISTPEQIMAELPAIAALLNE
ncbi:MAG: hypothetical protein SP1CHLAM54_06570 [Chlamydiia bacterium]|nr:hypothetical protein [Chlamydiia bacterium]MCH9615567.1 hypothetical protein [Chlamydiia bacterium]MCH9629222.1 hypothetical protein [Chlamydiia bacterium]